MAKKTAIDWFIKETIKRFKVIPKDTTNGFFKSIEDYKNMVEQAKKIEKKQIINAWRNGDNDSMYPPKELDRQAEEYYNETYN